MQLAVRASTAAIALVVVRHRQFAVRAYNSHMLIQAVPFSTIDWSQILPTEHAGDSGKAIWRTVEQGNLRVRRVEYTPGYKANHWCSRGHVLHVLAGELTTELQDGRSFILRAGETYIVADNAEPHRSRTETGVQLFIVD